MNLFKLLYKFFKDNIKIYKFYLFIIIVFVVVFYNFLVIENNEVFIEISGRF